MSRRFTDQYPIRFPDGLRDEIKAAAKANGRSMNAEIIHRLTNSGEAIGPRDWFAALAMGAIISGQLANGKDTTKADCQAISEDAYSFADAMLIARQSQEGDDA